MYEGRTESSYESGLYSGLSLVRVLAKFDLRLDGLHDNCIWD